MYIKEQTTDIPTSEEIGRKLIATALNMDAMIIELLFVEIKKAKKQVNADISLDSLSALSNLFKSVIMAMTLTDSRIRDGIELCSHQLKTFEKHSSNISSNEENYDEVKSKNKTRPISSYTL